VNRKPNTKLIGVFVSASIALLVGMIMFFGSTRMFSRSISLILFFDQSVNGLNVGSPVKYRGVPIGTVESVQIHVVGQDPDSRAIPVIIQIDRSHLENELGVSALFVTSQDVLDAMPAGLVAQLNVESLITGQLFVEFSFEPEKVVSYQPHLTEDIGIVEVPTLASPLDQITDDLVQLISKANAVDFVRLNENVNVALENLSVVLADIDSKGISESVTRAADNVNAFVDSEDFKDTLTAVRLAFEDIQSTTKSLNLKNGPLAETVERWTTRFEQSLDKLDRLSTQTSDIMEPDSSLRVEFENTLRELSRTALTVRKFADYLERNPNALLTGRLESGE
jgi:paraquat-inducible protein B